MKISIHLECPDGEFSCDLTRCITNDKRCDKIVHCDDRTDELDCPEEITTDSSIKGECVCAEKYILLWKMRGKVFWNLTEIWDVLFPIVVDLYFHLQLSLNILQNSIPFLEFLSVFTSKNPSLTVVLLLCWSPPRISFDIQQRCGGEKMIKTVTRCFAKIIFHFNLLSWLTNNEMSRNFHISQLLFVGGIAKWTQMTLN